MMTNDEKMMLQSMAWEGKRSQIQAVSSAILKLEMMGLTPWNGMVECPCPANIHPSRWTAMVKQGWKCLDSIVKGM